MLWLLKSLAIPSSWVSRCGLAGHKVRECPGSIIGGGPKKDKAACLHYILAYGGVGTAGLRSGLLYDSGKPAKRQPIIVAQVKPVACSRWILHAM